MLEELSIVRLASALTRHASVRHSVIADNVANSDTPNFRARDVRAFADYVNEGFTAKVTRAGHDGGARAISRPDVISDPTSLMSPNGNSVSLEGEMVKAAQAQGSHAMAQTIYRKVHDLMRLGLGRR